MTRHQKNATASTVYTYNERKKDQKASGYGTLEERLAKSAIKDFDCCSITLQRCRRPVVSPDGDLFDYEAILRYILHQKKENARKRKSYEEQLAQRDAEAAERQSTVAEKRARRFEAAEGTPARSVSKQSDDEADVTEGPSTSIIGDPKKMTSFWVPTLSGSVKDTAPLKPPEEKVVCPVTGKPIRTKDLVPVKFKLANGVTQSDVLSGKDGVYVCALTGDLLTNAIPCVLLKTSGNVITVDALEKVIKKDWIDPFTSQRINGDADLIYLRRGGTGFASTNENLKSKLLRPALELQ